jgi:hypothetical protein
MSEEMDQFHELKEYFRNVVSPTFVEWKYVPTHEKMHAKAIFVGCVGEYLIDYISFDKYLLETIQNCLSGDYGDLNLAGYRTLRMIDVAIDDPVSKIFYECTPSAEYKEINHEA